jgi:hypothetical protein
MLTGFLKSKESKQHLEAFRDRPIRIALSCAVMVLACAVSWSIVMPKPDAPPATHVKFKCTSQGCEGELSGAPGSTQAKS